MNAERETLQIGQVIDGRYRIVSDGKSLDIGTEYKAYDSQLERLVVALAIDLHREEGVEIVERVDMLQNELVYLASHSLLAYEHVGLVDGCMILVRVQVEGHSLADILGRNEPLEIESVLKLAIELAETIAPVHRAGLVHGGLSPHCIFIANDDHVTVTDIGLLPALRTRSIAPGQPWGRFPYISPEQAAGEDVHATSDVYLIGSLIYELLAGRPAHSANDEVGLILQYLRQDPASLQVLAPQVPLPLAQIVHKALSKESSARYRNAGQMAHILRSQFGLQERTSPPVGDIRQQEPGYAQLVVPPPPVPIYDQQWYQPTGDGEYVDDDLEGVDWLLIGMLITALIAVLGLIPLWRVVYQRYAIPSTATPVSHIYDTRSLEPVSHTVGLEDPTIFWTIGNKWTEARLVVAPGKTGSGTWILLNRSAPESFEGKSRVWEYRLRSWAQTVLHCNGNL